MNVELYNRVRILREALGLTQADFGEKLGVSKDVIANIEYDRLKTAPHPNFFKLMCKTFNVRNEWLFDGKGEMFLPTNNSPLDEIQKQYDLSDNVVNVLQNFFELSPEDQDSFIAHAKKILHTDN